MIQLTENAITKIRNLLAQNNKPDWGLRFAVKGGGCSGFTYTMDFAETPGETDQVIEADGIKIIVDPKSFVFLTGMQVDYVETLTESGFKFNNPNATRTCGCGSSFQV